MIRVLDVVEVVNDKLEADGLPLGTRVVVANAQAFPLSEDDPYTQRVKLFVQKLNSSETGVDGPIFLIDPASVKQTGLRAVEDDDTATN
jgi:hypothetical protein